MGSFLTHPSSRERYSRNENAKLTDLGPHFGVGIIIFWAFISQWSPFNHSGRGSKPKMKIKSREKLEFGTRAGGMSQNANSALLQALQFSIDNNLQARSSLIEQKHQKAGQRRRRRKNGEQFRNPKIAPAFSFSEIGNSRNANFFGGVTENIAEPFCFMILDGLGVWLGIFLSMLCLQLRMRQGPRKTRAENTREELASH